MTHYNDENNHQQHNRTHVLMNLCLRVCISSWEEPKNKPIYKAGPLSDKADVYFALDRDKSLKSVVTGLPYCKILREDFQGCNTYGKQPE